MQRNKTGWLLLIAAMAVFGFVGLAIAQDAQPGGGGQGGPGGAGGRDPEQMRQRMEQFRQQMADRLKADLGVGDDEWKVLQPKIEKVQTLAAQARSGRGMMGRGGPGGDNAPPPPAPQTEVEKKAADLQKVLADKEAKPEQIKTALTAYRDARTKAREDLEKAQKDLKDLLTIRQEAVLVSYGLLD